MSPVDDELINPGLYRRLTRRFGDVGVTNSGVWPRFTVRNGYGRITEAGEEYGLNCPYCSDTRRRLYIAAVSGSTVLKGTREVQFGLIANCFNETQCMAKPAFRKDLAGVLFRGEPPMLFHARRSGPRPSGRVVIPKNLVRLTELPANHQAVRYLTGRRFSIGYLDSVGLRFCPQHENPLIENRIFIPMRDSDNQLIGGQCRLPYDTKGNFPPKYYTLPGTKKSSTIYIRNEQLKLVVVGEGPFDALRFGKFGACTFGCRVHKKQLEILKHKDYIVFAYDSDLWQSDKHLLDRKALDRTLEKLRPHVKAAEILRLPPGKDPADMDEGELWANIRNLLLKKEGGAAP